jgi:hypothetical protein
MGVGVMVSGFVIDLLSAMLAAALLSCAAGGCCDTYFKRVGFVASLGVFLGLMAHGTYWNWMNFPADYTLLFIVDVVIGWTLVGLAIAGVVKAEPSVDTGD